MSKESEIDQLEAFETFELPKGRRWARRKTGSGLSEKGRYRTDAEHRERVLGKNREWERKKREADPEWHKQRSAKKNAARAARRATAKKQRAKT